MLLTTFTTVFVNKEESEIIISLIMRVCLVLIVNKNIQLAINFTKIVKNILLRTSFIIVLTILFWFALKTVNIFHIVFIILLLLFITRNSKSETNGRSFRNRNWKYLLFIFQFFLILRYSYQIAYSLNISF